MILRARVRTSLSSIAHRSSANVVTVGENALQQIAENETALLEGGLTPSDLSLLGTSNAGVDLLGRGALLSSVDLARAGILELDVLTL